MSCRPVGDRSTDKCHLSRHSFDFSDLFVLQGDGDAPASGINEASVGDPENDSHLSCF